MFNFPKETEEAKNLIFGFFQIMVKKEETDWIQTPNGQQENS